MTYTISAVQNADAAIVECVERAMNISEDKILHAGSLWTLREQQFDERTHFHSTYIGAHQSDLKILEVPYSFSANHFR